VCTPDNIYSRPGTDSLGAGDIVSVPVRFLREKNKSRCMITVSWFLTTSETGCAENTIWLISQSTWDAGNYLQHTCPHKARKNLNSIFFDPREDGRSNCQVRALVQVVT
jgi:hypothetical protein